MRLPPCSSVLQLLLAATTLPSAARAVFKDEVGEIDYHHELLGVPQRETTFFHRPRAEDKASLLYTLSDLGVLGAVNPTTGTVVWRQFLAGEGLEGSEGNVTLFDGRSGHLRAGEGAGWVCSALHRKVQGWDAGSGRSTFSAEFAGEVKDLEIIELTGSGRKDVLVLFEEDGATVVRRLKGLDGRVEWEFKDATRDIPLQVSTSVGKVFVVGLHGSKGSFALKVSVLDTTTGKRTDEYSVGSKGDIHDEKDVSFVGANSAAPVVAWTDEAKTKLRVHVLGTKTKQEFALPADTVEMEVHAPRLVQSNPHFLVHSWTLHENQADVYHVDLKTNAVTKAYSLPAAIGHGAFATSSIGANVYFTRITESDMSLTASSSDAALATWPRAGHDASQLSVLSAVSEVVKKSADTFAVRAAAVSGMDAWVLIHNGQADWARPEGLSGAIAGVYAEIPEVETLGETLDQEAHSNPLSAYAHRVQRHVKDMQRLPAYLAGLPKRLISSILGTEVLSSPESTNQLARDSFGLNKLVLLATKRGRLYCLDLANGGKIAWSRTAFPVGAEGSWNVKGMLVDNEKGTIAIQGARGEFLVVRAGTGRVIKRQLPGGHAEVQSTSIVDTESGPLLLAISKGGKVGDLPIAFTPKQTVVVQGEDGAIHGLTFVPQPDGNEAVAETTWTFTPPANQHIVSMASRPAHDPVSSLGRVLGDRRVKYKYLNPNTMVVATADTTAQTLTVVLLDTVSGEILSSSTHTGVDTAKGVHCALAENFFLCTFYGQYVLRDAPSAQALRGYQIVVSDLYESDIPDDRGALGDSANYSSLHPVDQATTSGGLLLPSVVSQSYLVTSPLAALAVTQTRQGISSRTLLAYLPQDQGIVSLPRMVLEPRRPVGRDPTPQEAEEGLIRYAPVLEIDPMHVVTHERQVLGVTTILTAPTLLESTVLVTAFGIDVFGTRVAPSLTFDYLGRGFNKLSLVATVLALGAGVMVLGPVVSLMSYSFRDPQLAVP
jgi:outer membrane protein assembly factor BamB